jgi:hypothetical protein
MANDPNAPLLSANLEQELSKLIDRSIELNKETLVVNQRIRELNEQVAQHRRHAETGEEMTRKK